MEFWNIYDQFYTKVRNFIFVLVKDEWVADDLIQETFIRVQQKLHQLREESKLSSWIFRIAYNLCQDHFRKSSRSLKKEQSLAEKNWPIPPMVLVALFCPFGSRFGELPV